MPRVSAAIVLIDGEHHPSAVRNALELVAAEREVAGVVFCGGDEKLRRGVLEHPEEHYGRPVETGDPEEALRRLAPQACAVLDLADEPVLPAARKLGLASLALHLGLTFEGPGVRLTPPRLAPVPFDGPSVAVIGTGKRTGKTAVAGHWATLLPDPLIVCMGRGGPAEPALAENVTLEQLERLAADGRHAASDYLEDALLAGVTTVGCRRVGGGLAGEPYESNVPEGAALAAARSPGVIVFEGSGSCLPPVEVHRTVCVVGDPAGALEGLGPYRLMRSQLVLARVPHAALAQHAGGPVLAFDLRPEPVEEIGAGARVAFFSTGTARIEGVEPVVESANLARRSALEGDLARAVAERCDVFLTELKAAAMDSVAVVARDVGARLVFVRNRPVGVGCDLDAALVTLYESARDASQH